MSFSELNLLWGLVRLLCVFIGSRDKTQFRLLADISIKVMYTLCEYVPDATEAVWGPCLSSVEAGATVTSNDINGLLSVAGAAGVDPLCQCLAFGSGSRNGVFFL